MRLEGITHSLLLKLVSGGTTLLSHHGLKLGGAQRQLGCTQSTLGHKPYTGIPVHVYIYMYLHVVGG